jgi:hypothetical protein
MGWWRNIRNLRSDCDRLAAPGNRIRLISTVAINAASANASMPAWPARVAACALPPVVDQCLSADSVSIFEARN